MKKYIIKYDDFREYCGYAFTEDSNNRGCNHPLWETCGSICTYCAPATAKDMIAAGFNEYDTKNAYESIPGYLIIYEWVVENKLVPENKIIPVNEEGI